MKKFFEEFKTFISRGNVMDMAIGVIIGGAFGAITSSLVADVVTPLLAALFQSPNCAPPPKARSPSSSASAPSSVRSSTSWSLPWCCSPSSRP